MLITIQTNNTAQTRALGALLGANMPASTVIAAEGDLGLGKTMLAQGIAAGLGINGPVTSPTFTYIQEYAGRLPFCHVDAYRLDGWEESDLAQLGLSECFTRHKTAYVEWPGFIRDFLPADVINLRFSATPTEPQTRLLSFSFDEQQHSWLAPLLLSPCERV